MLAAVALFTACSGPCNRSELTPGGDDGAAQTGLLQSQAAATVHQPPHGARRWPCKDASEGACSFCRVQSDSTGLTTSTMFPGEIPVILLNISNPDASLTSLT